MKNGLKEGLKWTSLVLGAGVIFTLFLQAVTVELGYGSEIKLPQWTFNGFEIVFGASRMVEGFPLLGNSVDPECFVFNFPLFLAYIFPLFGGICCIAENRAKAVGWVSVGLFGAGALLTALTAVLLPAGYGELIRKALELSDKMTISLQITVSAAWVLPFVLSLLGCGCALAVKLSEKKERKNEEKNAENG